MDWPHNPIIYEINTWVWLRSLSQRYGKRITLNNVPDEVLDDLARYEFDAIWLMGIWHRGPSTRASALNYTHEYVGALPDISKKDVAGSAYAIGNYEVERALGGRSGLKSIRKRLAERGMRIILDYVPNHTGHDHPWLREHPDYYIQGTQELIANDGDGFLRVETAAGDEVIIARGRDPYFPSWIDTAQLNAFSAGYRNACVETLCDMASVSDGVRCDMAMLMMNDIFVRTWGWLGIQPPEIDFWNEVVPRVKAHFPNFIFIAEVYWDMNYSILQQGFDYTYDKTMYDRLRNGDVGGVYAHLGADISYLERNIRFIENHDEPRAADAFGIDRSRAAAVLVNTVPGATLLHDGQFDGRIIKLPVQINRQPDERLHSSLREFYLRLQQEASDTIYREGEWYLFRAYAACEGCTGNYNLVTYGWRLDDEYRVIVLNMSGEWSQAAIDLSAWDDALDANDWVLQDALHGTYREVEGQALMTNGLLVDMDAYQAVVYHMRPMEKKRRRRKQRERSMA